MRIGRIGWPATVAIAVACAAVGLALWAAWGRGSLNQSRDSAGAQLIRAYGCGTCHTIPGIDGADAVVGPKLTGFDTRRVIAGRLPNTRENLARWIAAPQEVDPGNVMPDMGVTAAQARAIATYLYAQS